MARRSEGEKGVKVRGASSVDVVIIGAGAAGLAAARTAGQLGLTCVVCEAQNRIGGRAFTDPTPFGVPWDRGCHWLHSATINPFMGLADEYGFRYRTGPTEWQLRFDERVAAADESDRADAAYEAQLAAALAVGERGEDVALAAVVDRDDPWLWLFRAGVHAEWGMDLDAVSTLDLARYRDTRENWAVIDGYGALVARHAAGLAVELATPVERIAWGGEKVRVTTGKGIIEAKAAVVTVSTGVLAANTIAFDPPLPPWKQEAIAATPMGSANKVAFRIRGDRLGVAEHTDVVTRINGEAIGFELRPYGWDLASAYLAGPLGVELERAGPATMIDVTMQALAAIVGSDVARHVEATAATSWGADPYIRGAYAAAWPGQAHRRAELGRPLADRLCFAGEATSPEFFTTCHGAHLSGIAAVAAAARAISGEPESASVS